MAIVLHFKLGKADRMLSTSLVACRRRFKIARPRQGKGAHEHQDVGAMRDHRLQTVIEDREELECAFPGKTQL